MAASNRHRAWEGSWRKRWSKEEIDEVKRGTHAMDCFSTCAFDLYIKDGRVLREEQACVYPAMPGVPDFNPRGCQKGCIDSHYMYGPERLLYPLKRVGERGEGKWRRVSWDEALGEISDKILDAIQETGDPGSVTIHPGVGTLELVSEAAAHRAASLIGATQPDYYESLGDLPTPLAMCWGDFYYGHTSADWFTHDYIIIWFVNPNVTRMPDAHFFWEARHNGSTVVTVAPDMNPTAILSDYWVPVKPGTDGALGMAMINVVLNQKLYDRGYIQEQTDLPFLVRTDTRKFLRESDLKPNGRDDVFYFWDLASGGPVRAPGSMGDSNPSIALGDLNPALEGEWELETLSGKVTVRPVFEYLKEKASRFSPEEASRLCGIHPSVIRRMVYGYAGARRPMIFSGMGAFRWYNCDSNIRVLALFAALLGQIREENTGLCMWNGWLMEACEGDLYFPNRIRKAEQSRWDIIHARSYYKERIQSDTIWQWVHGDLSQAARKYYGDEYIDKLDEYLKQALDKDWMPSYPKNNASPRVIIFDGDNYFTRGKSTEHFRNAVLSKADLVVDINIKVTTTGLYSDIILPALSHYEKDDLRPQCFTPFFHALNAAVPAVGDARHDWEIFRLLMKKLEERAVARGMTTIEDKRFGVKLDFTRLHDAYTKGGSVIEPGQAAQYILDNSSPTRGMKFEQMKEEGYGSYPAVKEGQFRWVGEDQPFQSFRHITKKLQWRTLTGRQQSYIDHDWFLELGEELPSYQPPPIRTDRYPLVFVTSHSRWSMHSHWKTHEWMLRLERGEPVLHMNPDDGAARGLKDGDHVEVYNDVDSFVTQVKFKPGLPQGMIHMYHAWDPYLFRGGKGFQSPIVTLVKPTNLVDYGHLRYGMWYFAPNQSSQDVTVEVRKAPEEE